MDLCGHTHNYSTRSASKNILDIPYSQTYTDGFKSVCIVALKIGIILTDLSLNYSKASLLILE